MRVKNISNFESKQILVIVAYFPMVAEAVKEILKMGG